MDLITVLYNNDKDFNVDFHVQAIYNRIKKSYNKNKAININNLVCEMNCLSTLLKFVNEKNIKLTTACFINQPEMLNFLDLLIDIILQQTDSNLKVASVDLACFLLKVNQLEKSSFQYVENILLKEFNFIKLQQQSFLEDSKVDDEDMATCVDFNKFSDMCFHFADYITNNFFEVLIDEICKHNFYTDHFCKCMSLFKGILSYIQTLKLYENVLQKFCNSIFKYLKSNSILLLDYYKGYKDDSLTADCFHDFIAISVTLLHSLFHCVCNKTSLPIYKELKEILSCHHTWIILLTATYHKMQKIRRQHCQVFSLAVCCVENHKLSFDVSLLSNNSSHCEVTDEIKVLNCARSQDMAMIKQYFHICELLEESQTHLVLPAKEQINEFIQLVLEVRSCDALWVFSLLKRILCHENKLVQKEGLLFCFDPNIITYFVNHPFFNKFICCSLTKVLCTDAIYETDQRSVDDLYIFSQLCSFFHLCYKNHSKFSSFMKDFLSSICFYNWSSVSLLHVTEALLKVPDTKVWDVTDYLSLRHLFIQSSQQHNSTIKLIIQQNLVSCLMKHCSLQSFNLCNILTLFLLCSNFETLASNKPFWIKVVKWFTNGLLLLDHGLNNSDKISCVMKSLTDDCFITKDDKAVCTVDQLSLAFCLVLDGLVLQNELDELQNTIFAMIKFLKNSIDKAVLHINLVGKEAELCFKFIYSFSKFRVESSLENIPDFTYSCIELFESIIEYLSHYFHISKLDYNQIQLYLFSTEELIVLLDIEADDQQKVKVHSMLSSLITTIQQNLMLSWKFDQYFKENLFCFYWCQKINHRFCLPISDAFWEKCLNQFLVIKSHCFNFLVCGSNEKISTNILLLCWKCFPYMITKNKFLVKEAIQVFKDHMDIFPIQNLAEMYVVAAALFAQVSKDCLDVCSPCVAAMQRVTFELIHSSTFRPLYKKFVCAIFQPPFLSVIDGSILCNSLSQVFKEVQLHSFSKLGFLYQVLNCCQSYWVALNNDDCKCKFDVEKLVVTILSEKISHEIVEIQLLNLQSAHFYIDFLVHCIVYSPPPSKDIKSIQQAIALSNKLMNKLYIDLGFGVSLKASSIFLGLKLNNSEHMMFANILLNKLVQLDNVFMVKNPKQQFSSATYYCQYKIWQNILILIPTLKPNISEDFLITLVTVLGRTVEGSIRNLVEWCVVLVLFRFPQYESILFEKLKSTCKKPHQSVCSYLTIALLCGITRKYRLANQNVYFHKLIDLVLPWCMNQQFSIRLFAHAVLLRIYNHLKASGIQDSVEWIASCVNFAENATGNVKKNWFLIRQHFMLFHFDPISEYSLETLFVTFPRLCKIERPQLNEIERILPETWLPKFSLSSTLRELKCATWINSISKSSDYSFTLKNFNYSTNNMTDTNTNLQKKLVVGDQKKYQRNVIVIASLLEKPSNLGGLARTCEILGAKLLVVHNLNCIDNPAFQSLSVTAHKWLNIKEVKSQKLVEYLKHLKQSGYTIVGAEQTERSVHVNQYEFPLKSAIVLGNEKEGIPQLLLRFLDVCVEIPQVGIIRSFNAHVSGAITLWEYSKQHTFTFAKL